MPVSSGRPLQDVRTQGTDPACSTTMCERQWPQVVFTFPSNKVEVCAHLAGGVLEVAAVARDAYTNKLVSNSTCALVSFALIGVQLNLTYVRDIGQGPAGRCFPWL